MDLGWHKAKITSRDELIIREFPQVPGRPLCPYALLLDPGRTEDARPLRRLDMAPARVNNEGSRDEKDFGARSHGLGTGCLRFVLAVTRHDARLASGCLAQLGRAGFCDPQGCDERFPSLSLIPFPRLILTQ